MSDHDILDRITIRRSTQQVVPLINGAHRFSAAQRLRGEAGKLRERRGPLSALRQAYDRRRRARGRRR